MYMCIFSYFNYYLPDFVTSICLGFIFGFLFLDVCFNLTKCHNKPLVESSFLNRDHSVVFEIASKYCISDCFVDHDGYSIFSKGFLPTVVDIMVI